MYKLQTTVQLAFEDFNQPIGLKMNPSNRWIQKAELIPWAELEKDYAKNFRNKKGNVAKPFRMAFGALLIQKEYSYSDEETVLQIQENPYLQFFIGLPGYQDAKPFDASTMVYFRKRLDETTLIEINEKILVFNKKKDDKDNDSHDDFNSGTLILDATCAPQNIKYPTDTELLNDARTHAEKIIDVVCEGKKLKKPRVYRKKARRVYLGIVRRKKKAKKWLRAEIRKLLSFVKRDIKVIKEFLEQGILIPLALQGDWETLQKVYEQQQFMYDNKTHSVAERIVSFHQPWVRPIVRGKQKAAVEFGAKFDLSIDQGFGRIEKSSFEAYNESEVLVGAVRHYHDRHGCYPERVLADKIYRNRGNLSYCKGRGIRLSGPALGRPKKDEVREKAQDYKDNADRIEVERSFSKMKRCFGANLITTKLKGTTLTSIALSVIALNLSKLTADFLHTFFGKNQKFYFWKQLAVFKMNFRDALFVQ